MTDFKNVIWNVAEFEQIPATTLYNILKTRSEVFVVEQNCSYLDADGTDDKAIHLWAEYNGTIAAYCRIFGSGIKYNEPSIGRVLTHGSFRNVNLGKMLMRNALQILETKFETTAVRISAQDYLLSFYSGFGFAETGKKYLEDGIPHSEMIKK